MTNKTKIDRVKTFVINEEWRVKRDYNGNHQPERFRTVTHKGVSTDKWMPSPKYFATLPMAMQDIIDVELFEGLPASVGVVDALKAYKRITAIFAEALISVS
jgi:hypothetical protein